MFTNLFETYLALSGYDVKRSETLLQQIQKLNPDEFQTWQEKQRWRIARHHYEHNDLYRAKVGPHFPDHWEDLPIMHKSDYQIDLAKMLSRGYTRQNTYIANTSGSSGQPFYFAKNKAAHAMDWAVIKDRYHWHDLSLTSKQARFYGIPLGKWSYRKEKIKDLIMNRVRFPVFDLSDEMLQKALALFERKEFEYIYGYANSLVAFARYLARQRVTLRSVCPTLSKCISTSEMLFGEDRKLLSEAFGVAVINEYGASEVGLLAFENPQKEWLLCEETVFVETLIPNEWGDASPSGSIIVTDLDNLAMPFVRYAIGDLGVVGVRSSSESNNRILESLAGRENDTIKLPGGKISPGLTFYYVSRSILESSNILKEFIIRQTALDTFIFELVSDRDLNDAEIQEIGQAMDKYLEPGLKLEIRRVPEIKRPLSGKIKHFYSEIS